MSDDLLPLQTLFDQAIAHHRAGRFAEAGLAYRQVLEKDPQQFDALRLLGRLAHERGANEEAASLLERSIALRDDVPETFNDLGSIRQALNDPDAARACFERALALQPNFYEARLNLGHVLGKQCQYDSARAEFETLASTYPDRAEVHANLGVVLQEQGKVANAVQCYRKAISIKPDLVEAHFNLAVALNAQGNLPAAIEECQSAVRFDPRNQQAHIFLGRLFDVLGRRTEAQHCFKVAIASRPEFVEARWSLVMSELPLAYGPGEDPNERREAFVQSLSQLEDWLKTAPAPDGFIAVGSSQPFYLAYQECDNRALLSRYGDLCADLMGRWGNRVKLAAPTVRRTGKVRVGIVSGKIYDQSVWTAIVKGWCQHLDQRRFELHLFYTGATVDRETELAKSLVGNFVTGPKNLHQWSKEILSRELDIAIYPEIGMDQMSVRLASLRLAAVQAASWGHPETTGLPTIDYYISAEDFEPPGAQAWYREKLVPLPGLGCVYEPHNVSFDASSIDSTLILDRSGVLLLCPGTPYKYAPRHDRIFIEIARRAPECRFVFCHDAQSDVSGLVQKRLQAAFERGGMRFEDHGMFLPHLRRAEFFGLMQVVDACLDSVGFSGFNTAMQAVECGLPIVAYEGPFMRGRFASGILRHIGLADLVASTEERYIDVVVKLSTDVSYLQRARGRLAEASPVLFRDLAPVRALEDFLESAARDARST